MRRHPRRRPAFTRRSERLAHREDQIAFWVLKTLLRAGAARQVLDPERPLDDALLHAVGVARPPGDGDRVGARHELKLRLAERLRALERRRLTPCMASHNARLMGDALGLNRTETAVLGFVIALQSEPLLSTCLCALHCDTQAELSRAFARVLGLRHAAVHRALGRDGALRRLALVRVTRRDEYEECPLQLTDAAARVLLRPLVDAQELVRHFLLPTPVTKLTLADYPHLAGDVALLSRMLGAALKRRARGVNVLLHGPPGTGKTELARALAASLGATLDAVALEDDDQDALRGDQRLGSYALCQRILRGRKDTLLLFDEAEDAFPIVRSSLGLIFQGGPGHQKAWTNRLLEENPIPTLWVSNSIEQLDRAYVRRFDFVLEVPQPPRTVRRRLIGKHLARLPVGKPTLDQLADREELSPGHVQQAARLLRLLAPRDATEAEADLLRVVNANLRAFGGKTAPRRGDRDLPYDPGLLNLSVDVPRLVEGLARSKRGTLCFHGAPGTGKTALAAHLARQLDLPLASYRASDLLDMYVGQTEKRIAQMFERAAANGALLLLDEADSFLTDRSHAVRSWEVTQVNEMLTQMEHFDGLFICSTNLVDRLDRAALRRFAIKVKFDYLRPEQAARLFREVLAQLGAEPNTRAVATATGELARLRNLTPGDFAAVIRRLRTLGAQPEPAGLLALLREECELKRDGRGVAIGFGG